MYLKKHSQSLLRQHLNLLVHPLQFQNNSLQIRFLLYVVLSTIDLFILTCIIWSGPNYCIHRCGLTSANSCPPKTSINPENNCMFLSRTSFKPSYTSTLIIIIIIKDELIWWFCGIRRINIPFRLHQQFSTIHIQFIIIIKTHLDDVRVYKRSHFRS